MRPAPEPASAPSLAWLAKIYEDYGVGRTERFFAHLAEDVVWVSNSSTAALRPFAGTFLGHEGVRRFFEILGKDWALIRWEVEGMTQEGELIHVRNRVLAVNLNTGKHVETRTRHCLTIRGETILRFEESYDDELPIAAAGHLDSCSPVSRGR